MQYPSWVEQWMFPVVLDWRAEWTFSINGNREQRVKHVNFIKSHYVDKDYTHPHKTILSKVFQTQFTSFERKSNSLSCFLKFLLTIHFQSRPWPNKLFLKWSSAKFGKDEPSCSGSVVKLLFSIFRVYRLRSLKIRLSNDFWFTLLIWKRIYWTS